jgi:hypothetical protein
MQQISVRWSNRSGRTSFMTRRFFGDSEWKTNCNTASILEYVHCEKWHFSYLIGREAWNRVCYTNITLVSVCTCEEHVSWLKDSLGTVNEIEIVICFNALQHQSWNMCTVKNKIFSF